MVDMMNIDSNDLDSTVSAPSPSTAGQMGNNLNCNIDPLISNGVTWSSSQAIPSAPSPGLVLFNSEDQSDLIFIVTMDSNVDEDNLKFPGHSFIIKESSPIFEDIFRQIDQLRRPSSSSSSSSSSVSTLNDKKPIINIQCRPETLHNLMSFIYKKEVILNSVPSCLALLDLSIKFMLTELTCTCLTFLRNNITEFNVLLVLSSLRKIDFKPFKSTRSSRKTTHNKREKETIKVTNGDDNNLNLIDYCDDDDDDDNDNVTLGPRVTRSSSITSVICLSTEGQQSFPQFGNNINHTNHPPHHHHYHQIKHNHISQSNEIIQNLINELISRCYCILDEFAESIISSEAICNVDRNLLVKILTRDTLRLSSELVAFQALERWSICECQRQLIEINGTNKMSVLGEAIYSVRYLTMPLMVFMKGPFTSDILTEMDKNYLQSKILDPCTKLAPHLIDRGLDIKRKWIKPTKSVSISPSSSSLPKSTPTRSSSSSSSSSSPPTDQGFDRKKKPAIKKFLNGLGDVMIFAIRIFD